MIRAAYQRERHRNEAGDLRVSPGPTPDTEVVMTVGADELHVRDGDLYRGNRQLGEFVAMTHARQSEAGLSELLEIVPPDTPLEEIARIAIKYDLFSYSQGRPAAVRQ